MLIKCRLIFLAALILSNPINAEVITDGTVGNPVTLTAPNYQLTQDLGKTVGSNLFHSFEQFNLYQGETATFSGSSNVKNVISRVTGGNASTIDGTLRSTMPNAELYFLNPSGILFGPHANLDVQGSFHASTADYLRFSDGGRFDAKTPNNSLLTVAPVAAFCFLTDLPASIKTKSTKLSVPAEKTLSLIGGDLHFTSDVPLTADNSQVIPTVTSESILATQHGRVNLASLASRGEVIPSDNDLILEGKGGKITMENTLVELSGSGGGATFIRAGQFILDNTIIRSNTFGNQDGKDINLKVTETAYLKGVNSEIAAFAASMSNAGSILIDVPYLEVTSALIDTGAIFIGEAGPIEIDANSVFLKEGAWIASGALGGGRSSNLTFRVADHLSLSGFYPGFRLIHAQVLENSPSMIFTLSLGTQPSGNIWVSTQELNLKNGAITAATHGIGRGGDITIHTQSARLVEGGFISTITYQMAPAGDIKIQVVGPLYLAGWTPVEQISLGRNWGIFPSQIESGTNGNNGTGGMVDIQANEVILTDSGFISSASRTTGGDAGKISITANTLRLTERGNITTSAEHAGGGDIYVTVANQLYLRRGQITTSVAGGIGDGGNIIIDNPQFVVMNQGNIIAQADAGHGGNIHIVAQHFLNTPDSLISASSRMGLDGKVEIDSPEDRISDDLLALSTGLIDVSGLLPRSCESISFEEYINPSSFMVNRIAGTLTPSPFDLKPSHLLFQYFPTLQTMDQVTVSKKKKVEREQQLAWLMECHRFDGNGV